MTSQIEEALKEQECEFYISNEERITLCEILANIGVILKTGQVYFNGKGKHNDSYADLCIEVAKRLANMPVHKEN